MSTITKKKIQYKNGNTYLAKIESYASIDEMVRDCKTRKVLISEYGGLEKKKHLDKSWTGVSTYAEALELLRVGYQPTVEKLKVAYKGGAMGVQKRIKFQNEIQGFAPVVPLALKNVPECMINMTMKSIKCKVIDVYYDTGVSSYVTPEEVIKAGQKLLGTIISLEKQGYRFNLYSVNSFAGSSDADILCVKIKSSDKPIDLKRISFPLTHPAFCRVIAFDWQAKSPIAKDRGYGRGKPLRCCVEREVRKEFSHQAFSDNAVYLECSEIIDENEEYIKEVLTK